MCYGHRATQSPIPHRSPSGAQSLVPPPAVIHGLDSGLHFGENVPTVISPSQDGDGAPSPQSIFDEQVSIVIHAASSQTRSVEAQPMIGALDRSPHVPNCSFYTGFDPVVTRFPSQ